jgi:hypothetical protein
MVENPVLIKILYTKLFEVIHSFLVRVIFKKDDPTL